MEPVPGSIWDTEYLLPNQKEKKFRLFQRALSQSFLTPPPEVGFTPKSGYDTNMNQMSVLTKGSSFHVLGFSFKVLNRHTLSPDCMKSIYEGVFRLIVGERCVVNRPIDDVPSLPCRESDLPFAALSDVPFGVELFWSSGLKLKTPALVRTTLVGVIHQGD